MYLTQEPNTVTPARTRTQTSQNGVQRVNKSTDEEYNASKMILHVHETVKS